jgi:hypothetical protein
MEPQGTAQLVHPVWHTRLLVTHNYLSRLIRHRLSSPQDLLRISSDRAATVVWKCRSASASATLRGSETSISQYDTKGQGSTYQLAPTQGWSRRSSTRSTTRAVSSAAKRSQMSYQQSRLKPDSQSLARIVDGPGIGRSCWCLLVGSLHIRSSSRARVEACRKTKYSAPSDRSKTRVTRLHKESAQRRGKCSSRRESPDEAPKKVLLWVSSVRECCVGVRKMRGQRVPQK